MCHLKAASRDVSSGAGTKSSILLEPETGTLTPLEDCLERLEVELEITVVCAKQRLNREPQLLSLRTLNGTQNAGPRRD